jgi:DNA-binding CsgD family transcriptional regulator
MLKLIPDSEEDVERGGRDSGATLQASIVLDGQGRLVYMSKSLAAERGIELEGDGGPTMPFPGCQGKCLRACRARVQFMASEEARNLGIVAVVWNDEEEEIPCLNARSLEPGSSRLGLVVRDPSLMAGGMLNASTVEIERLRGGLTQVLSRVTRDLDRLGLSDAVPRPDPIERKVCHDQWMLSKREAEVLKPFTAGHRVASIARQLYISPHTVRNHLQSIYRKAGVNGQAELMEKLHGTTG